MAQRLIEGIELYEIVKLLTSSAKTSESKAFDPIHAAGGCYCRECKHWDREICDEIKLKWGRCHKALDCYGNSSTITEETDFCSRGNGE